MRVIPHSCPASVAAVAWSAASHVVNTHEVISLIESTQMHVKFVSAQNCCEQVMRQVGMPDSDGAAAPAVVDCA